MSNFQMAKGVLHTYKGARAGWQAECCLGRVTDSGGGAGNGLWRWLQGSHPILANDQGEPGDLVGGDAGMEVGELGWFPQFRI